MAGVAHEDVRRFRASRMRLLRPASDLQDAVGASLPLPCSPAAYVSAFARLDAFSPADLDALVFADHSLRIHPLHHGGHALVPFEELSALMAGQQFAWGSQMRRSKVARRINDELSRKAAELVPSLSTRHARAEPGERRALDLAATRGEVVVSRDPPTLFGDPTYGVPRAADRVPAAATDGYAFLQDLALAYFRAAGPASRDDFLWWAGLSRSAARHTIEDLAGLLEEVDIEGERKAQFMLEEDAAEVRHTRAPRTLRAAFLPSSDPAGAATRAGFAPLCEPRMRPTLAPGGRGKPRAIVAVGGSAIGGWTAGPSVVEVTLSKALTSGAEEALESERARLHAFLAGPLAAHGGPPTRRKGWRRLL